MADKRFSKTDVKLKEALATLLQHKEIADITVRELAEAADINRVTFYDHYEDIYDIYNKLIREMEAQTTSFLISEDIATYEAYYTALIHYLYDNKPICKMLFGREEVPDELVDELTAECKRIWVEESSIDIDSEMDMYAHFRVCGIIGALRRWVKSDFEMPPEKLIHLLTDIDSTIDEHMITRKTFSDLEYRAGMEACEGCGRR